jgi:hypothetical protein
MSSRLQLIGAVSIIFRSSEAQAGSLSSVIALILHHGHRDDLGSQDLLDVGEPNWYLCHHSYRMRIGQSVATNLYRLIVSESTGLDYTSGVAAGSWLPPAAMFV